MILNRLIFLWLLLLPQIMLAAATQNCATCHAQEYRDWQQSHHALAMQVADQNTVLGNFANVTFENNGVVTRFFIQNGKYYIHTQGANGKAADFWVQYTFGIDPLQQYLVQLPQGRLQAFTIAWDTRRKQWFSVNDQWPWSKRVYTWNHFCADCHSTNLQKNYSAATDTYHTDWSALNVTCQACHGTQKQAHAHTKKPASTQIVESCAFCHSRRHAITATIHPGTPLLDNYMPEILRKNIYFADGGLQEEDYEYGSFVQSKMYSAGVACTDCHNPHSLQLVTPGNGVCLQCHNPQPPIGRFPGLIAKNYDSPAHHFHKPGSAGAQCVSCHMPPKTYMQVDVRRDHYFRIPRPDLTVKYGIPNACNLCHTKKSAQWAADQIVKWYGKKTYSNDVTEILTLGRAANPKAEIQLIALSKDLRQAAIVRATAIELLQQYPSTPSLAAQVAATQDADALVRTIAVQGLKIMPGEERVKIVAPLLNDSIRSVRIEAARTLANVPKDLLNGAQQKSLQNAFSEYQAAQNAQLDQPEANLNLGVLAQQHGDAATAEHYYHTALHQDRSFYPASENLAILYSATNQPEKAIKTLQQSLQYNKNQGELYYSLGLLFAAQNDYQGSVLALAQAVQLLPPNPRIDYNYSLALENAGDIQQAESVLLKAYRLYPQNLTILSALMNFYTRQRRWDDAHEYQIKWENQKSQGHHLTKSG